MISRLAGWLANPLAMILSAAMMLEWLPSERCKEEGKRIRAAVDKTLLVPGNRTADLGGSLSTDELTDRIIRELEATACLI